MREVGEIDPNACAETDARECALSKGHSGPHEWRPMRDYGVWTCPRCEHAPSDADPNQCHRCTAADERAAIVAFLKRFQKGTTYRNGDDVLAAIEAGEHLRRRRRNHHTPR